MDIELERFKLNINLFSYATSHGYLLDKSESYRGVAVLRKGSDKISVTKSASNGHYIYASLRNTKDSGTIIDFIQHRRDISLAEVRKDLRAYMGLPEVQPACAIPLEQTPKDRTRVLESYSAMGITINHPYLIGQRNIPREVLSSQRFAGRVKIDAMGNAVFPHVDAKGLCGYEVKNDGFTGFSTGGKKGLWLSQHKPDDNTYIFCESAIDCLSHSAISPGPTTRYASIGGQPSSGQLALVQDEISRMPGRSTIVAAMDSDEAGRRLNEIIRTAVDLTNNDLVYRVHIPSAKDWNEMIGGKSSRQQVQQNGLSV